MVVDFDDGITYEVLPAFLNSDGSYTFGDTNNGGSWRSCNPKKEMEAFARMDKDCNANLVNLCRMARAWRDYNNVPMNGMLIDTLAYQFIRTWGNRDKSYFYYDLMTRDFFAFLAGQDRGKDYWLAPGSSSYVRRKGMFEFKARQAEMRATEAIHHEVSGYHWSARQRFREIYGSSFPL